MHTRTLRTTVCLLLLALASRIMAQVPTTPHAQTIRGTVLDADSHEPLVGASVIVEGSEPLLATSADGEGRFSIANVPTGRIDLRVAVMGYEEQRLSNLLLVSGKELVVNVHMQSAVTRLKEAEVIADRPNGEVRNDMATLSARRIGVEETSRIAGGINDPARMVSTFPGVAGDATGDNSIVVRGNSPKGVLWRLEGIEIPNPNHFSEEGSTGGPINVLNSDMLDNSEFYSGAFPAEYGNATSAVFDMRLRDGNDEEREYTLKAGVLGTDITAEGPLGVLKGGSYLANYRYSTLALLDQAGVVDYQGVPKYTDAAFKLKMPTARYGTISLFGLGGISHILQEERSEAGDSLFARSDFGSRMGVVGLVHTLRTSENAYLRSSVSLSGAGSTWDYVETDAPGEVPLQARGGDDLGRWTVRAATTLNNKFSAKHKLRSGIIVSVDAFRMTDSYYDHEAQRMITSLASTGSATTVQAFSSWKWRWNERWTLTSGVHLLHFTLNGSTSVEPRAGLRFQVRPDRALTFGAGLHARTEAVTTYLAQLTADDGSTSQPDRDLGLTRAAHAVVGFEQLLAEDVQLKAEAYYQHMFGLPVENDPTSSFSTANLAEWFTTKPLVNEGAGRNYGVELAVEKYFTRGWHALFTTSLSRSEYRALDGVWRHTRFDMGTVVNVLAGKEWKVGGPGKDRVFGAGGRYSATGGQYATPIDLEASIAAGEQKEGGEPWSVKGDAVHKLDLVLTYRVGRPKVSHEFKADVQNVLNSRTIVYRYFDRRTRTIENTSQLPVLPVLQYTLRF